MPSPLDGSLQAPDLVIVEVTQDAPISVRLTSREHSAPAELPVGGEQREHRTYYPGQRQPTTQVLGDKQDDIQLEGTLDDRYLLAGTGTLTALNLQQAMDNLRARGNRCRLTWGPLRVEGFVKQAKFRIRNEALIQYLLLFAPASNEQPILAQPTRSRADLAGKSAQADALSKALAALTAPAALLTSAAAQVEQLTQQVASRLAQVTSAAAAWTDAAADLSGQVRRLVGLAASVRTDAANVIDALHQLTSDTVVTAKDALSLLSFADWRDTALNLAREAAVLAIGLEDQLTTEAELIAVHVVRDGETLQRLALVYFGDPTRWQEIADQNDLDSTVMVAGQVLTIGVPARQ